MAQLTRNPPSKSTPYFLILGVGNWNRDLYKRFDLRSGSGLTLDKKPCLNYKKCKYDICTWCRGVSDVVIVHSLIISSAVKERLNKICLITTHVVVMFLCAFHLQSPTAPMLCTCLETIKPYTLKCKSFVSPFVYSEGQNPFMVFTLILVHTHHHIIYKDFQQKTLCEM